LKYRYPEGMKRGDHLWNYQALLKETEEPALVVEGVWDGLPHWPDVAACLGKPTRNQYPLLLAAKRPLIVVLDGDAWEECRSLALKLRLDGMRVKWLRLPPRTDPGEYIHAELMCLAESEAQEGILLNV
jgi:hypothetical protein